VTGHPPNGDGTMTTTCLQNMLVLSAGTTMTPDPRGQTINAPTVTLLVDPEQAETLTLANSEGRIQLVLRNSSDQTIEKTTGRFVSELYGSQRKPVAAKPEAVPQPKRRVEVARAPEPPPVPVVAPPAPPPPPDQIIVIRGTTRTVEVMPARPSN
jgi:pilus assembly protein CpaB